MNEDYYYSRLIMLSDADPSIEKNPIIEASKLPKLELILFPNGNKWLAEQLVLQSRKGKLYSLSKVEDIVNIFQLMFEAFF